LPDFVIPRLAVSGRVAVVHLRGEEHLRRDR
jgi:hypothetical protein